MNKVSTLLEKIGPYILILVWLVFSTKFVFIGLTLLYAIVLFYKFFKSRDIYIHLISGILCVLLAFSAELGGIDFHKNPYALIMFGVILIWKYFFVYRRKKQLKENDGQ